MIPNIKKSNYWIICDFARGTNRPEMQGTKLKALYTLIQKKGEPIQANMKNLNGVKALKISECEYVAMIRTEMKENSFYPCKLKTILMTSLNEMA